MTNPRHAHRRARAGLGVPAGAVVGAVLVALGVGGGTVLALHGSGSGSGGAAPAASSAAAARARCGGSGLAVVTSPGLVDAVRTVADAYAKQASGDGRCVAVTVTAKSDADTAELFGHAQSTAGLPDVWIPNSADWATLARGTGNGARLVPASGPAVATSPTVIAMPKPMAAAIGWPDKQLTWAQLRTDENDAAFWSEHGHADWGPFVLKFANPKQSLPSLQTVLAYSSVAEKAVPAELTGDTFNRGRTTQSAILDLERGAGVVPATEEDLLGLLRQADQAGTTLKTVSATPMQESDLIQYNQGAGFPRGTKPKTPLVAAYPTDGLYNQQVPYLVTTSTAADGKRSAAAGGLLDALRGGSGQAALAAAGFRSPAGADSSIDPASGAIAKLGRTTSPAASASALGAGRDLFTAIHHRGAILAVIDTSGSMADIVPGTSPPESKLQVAINALVQGVHLFASDNQIGVWQFATNLNGTTPWLQRSPVVALSAKGRYGTHLDDLLQLAHDVFPQGDTALYETTLAAYQARTSGYVPGKLNDIVLVTDGQEDTPGKTPMSLSSLITQLKKLYNPKRPVRIVTIAYGKDADPTVLRQISAATGAQSYQSIDPTDIFGVIVDAVLDSGKT